MSEKLTHDAAVDAPSIHDTHDAAVDAPSTHDTHAAAVGVELAAGDAAVGARREPITRTVLELRIHGVGNTAPEHSLDLPLDAIEMVEGDKLGGFWQPKRRIQNSRQRGALSRPDPDIRLEAYSWGKLARTSVPGGSSNRIVGGLARLGWMLLIPFALINVAYWARRLDGSEDNTPHPQFAGTLRLAGLLLTLLLAASVSVISLDLIAVQCAAYQCAAASNVLGFADTWTVGQRLAAGSLIPVAIVAALAGLGAATRARYERPDPLSDTPQRPRRHRKERRRRGPDGLDDTPLLSRTHFWGHQAITLTAAGIHVAATATLITTATAWHFAFGEHPSCARIEELFQSQCIAEASSDGANSAALGVVVAGILILLWCAAVLVRRSDFAGGTRLRLRLFDRARYVCGVAFILFAIQLILLAFEPRETQPHTSHLIGISAVPAVSLAGLLTLCVSALLWRQTRLWHRSFRHVPNILGLAFTVSLLVVGFSPHHWWVLAIPVAIGVAIYRWTRQCQDDAWRGTGPGIGLISAVVTAMLFSTSVVAVAGSILNGPAPVTALSTPDYNSYGSHPNLLIPLPYTWFGASSLPALAIMGAVIALAAIRSSRWKAPSAADPNAADTLALRAHRRVAAIAQRAEGYVAALAVVGGCAVSATLVLAVADASLAEGSVVRGPIGVGIWLMAAVGISFGVSVLFRGASGSTRPIGLIWDLICFLPRGGHPLGPPCYAERVVPELAWRCREWLDGDDGRGAQPRTVVLSAHSLGSVLAVAVILSPILSDAHRQRISLITYGSQLRAYFGRIFPELIGPKVVGAPPGPASSLISLDPWRVEKRRLTADPTPLGDPLPNTLCAKLTDEDGTVRWRNLWRRTDYIGFPVWGYPGMGVNPVDRPAEEVDDSGYLNQVATHSGYPRSRAYRTALRELCDRATLEPPHGR